MSLRPDHPCPGVDRALGAVGNRSLVTTGILTSDLCSPFQNFFVRPKSSLRSGQPSTLAVVAPPDAWEMRVLGVYSAHQLRAVPWLTAARP